MGRGGNEDRGFVYMSIPVCGSFTLSLFRYGRSPKYSKIPQNMEDNQPGHPFKRRAYCTGSVRAGSGDAVVVALTASTGDGGGEGGGDGGG